MNKHMNTRGFTLIELLYIVMAMGLIAVYFMIQQVNDHRRQQARDIATITKIYANMFVPYLKNMNESNLYYISRNNECKLLDPFLSSNSDTYTFTLDDLKRTKYQFAERYFDDERPRYEILCSPSTRTYYNDMWNGLNDFKQKPCLGITKDQAGNYHGFMYWANTVNSVEVPQQVARMAIGFLGGNGGYVKGNNIIGSNWSVPTSDPRFNNALCGGKIADNSVVINFDEYMPVNDDLNPRIFLGRESDNIHQQGTAQNLNTAQTNIIMGGNKIIFDKDNNVTMQTQNGITTVTGDFIAESIAPMEEVDSGTPCSDKELSMLKRQKDLDLRSLGVQISTEVCTYSPIICQTYNAGDYCYLPTKKSTIRYTDFGHTGKLGAAARCPVALPYMKSATAWQQSGSPTIQEVKANFGKYTMIYGAQAISDPSSNCTRWQFDYLPGVPFIGRMCSTAKNQVSQQCNANSNFNAMVCNNRVQANVSIQCNGKSTDGGAHNWKCLNSNPSPVILETMTCTNKYFMEQTSQ